MKKHILPILILFQVVLLSLVAGIFFLAANNPANAYANTANRGSEIVSQDAPNSLKELQNADEEQLDYWASSLAKFDGRNFDYITPARDQTVNRNTCWAFAAVGAVEASILREGIDITATKENLDFDETIAAYTRHTRKGDEDPLLLTANDTYDYGKWNQGDNAVNAFAIMTQGYSLVKENHFHTSVSESDIRDKLEQSKYYIQSYQRVPDDRNAIKRAILQYGAVTFNYSSPTPYVKYYDKDASANHTSIIIGWDDNMPSSEFKPDKPENNGAWIVKNSYGNYYGYDITNGTACCYISYDLPIGYIYAVDLAMREDYQNIYHYDGDVTVSSIKYPAEAQAAIYEAKLSSPAEQEQLKAVMISVPENNLNVNVKIYKNLKANPGNVNDKMNKPDQGVPVAELDKHIKYSGMHTIDLKEPISLNQGEYFSIVISCKNGNDQYVPVNCARENGKEPSVNDMTYYYSNGEWISYKSSDNYADTSYINLSAKIRAITNTVERKTDLGKNLEFARVDIPNRLVYYAKDKQLVPELNVYLGDDLTVDSDDKLLKERQDYTIAVQNNDSPGMVTIVISGQGEYTGTRTTYFEVAKAKEPPGVISGTVTVYNDTINLYDIPIPSDWQWVDKNKELEYGTTDDPVSLVYVGKDKNFYQNTTCTFYVNKLDQNPPADIDISTAEVEILGDYVYTGEPIVPSVKVTSESIELHYSIDYTLTFQSNIDAGTATVIVKGNGRYFNQTSQSFEIQKARWPKEKPNSIIKVSDRINNLNQILLNCNNWAWQTPDLELASDNFQATAVYTGQDKNNYINTEMQITVVREAQLEIALITELRLDTTSFVYDGHKQTPNVIARDGALTLSKGVDFEIEYQNNIFAGQATVIVKGKNNYTGTKELSFTILRAEKPNVDTTIRTDKKATKLSDISLPEGFVWEDGDIKLSADKITAKAIYTGEDASSYNTTELYFEIILETDKAGVNLIWLSIAIPASVLVIAGAVFFIVKHKRSKTDP